MDGVIVVDKPEGWTSHDVVGKVRRILKQKSVGHLGTLDPFATGVLPLVVGGATRLARFFTANDKRYDGVIQFGITTDSYDRDGEILSSSPDCHIGQAQLEQALEAFRGVLSQTPPPVSAKKIGGKRAYQLARAKLPVELKPVEVTVHSLELVEFAGLTARVLIHCGAGTYVRSIAHDLGQHLGCGAILQKLRRLSSGDFTEQQAYTLKELEQLASSGELHKALIPAAQLLPHFPTELIDALTASQIRQGRDFRTSPFRVRPDSRYVKAIDEEGGLVAIGEARLPNLYHPVLVLPATGVSSSRV